MLPTFTEVINEPIFMIYVILPTIHYIHFKGLKFEFLWSENAL